MTELWCLKWTRPLTVAEQEQLTAALPPHRRKRKAGDEALCAYGLLRLAMGGGLPAMALGERGKPYFPEFSDSHFSISHTDGAALVGISDQPIGVDIENIRPIGPRVKEKLGADLSDEEAFHRWTALEAHAKRTGRGVGEFLHGDMRIPKNCTALEIGEGYCASVDCEGEFTVRYCTLEDIFK